MQLRILMIKEPELFQLPIHHVDNNIFLHFRISNINEWTNAYREDSQELEISEFVNSNINWFPVDIDDNFKLTNIDPIIMIPFHNNEYNYLVIDGNHRLSYHIKKNMKSIKVINIAEVSVTESNIFASGFDKYYYIFMNELNHMARGTHYFKKNAIELMYTSFLTDGKLKFYTTE